MRIILVGFMGSGKTSVGKKLAKRLGFDFLDTDECIALEQHLTINQIFEKHGEHHFRSLEKEYISRLKTHSHVVISTGGGLPCFHNNMEELKQLGHVIYLKLSPIELTKRLLESHSERPLVKSLKTSDELETYIQKTLEWRSPYYEQAHYTPIGKMQRVNELHDHLTQLQLDGI